MTKTQTIKAIQEYYKHEIKNVEEQIKSTRIHLENRLNLYKEYGELRDCLEYTKYQAQLDGLEKQKEVLELALSQMLDR